MPRVFLSFPNGYQGIGLFLLRLGLAGSLLVESYWRLRAPAPAWVLLDLAQIPAGAMVLIGLWADYVAILVCLLQLGMLALSQGSIGHHLLQADLALALAFLGPGAWSLDARLFGRRRVEIKTFRDD